jgi:hypothetical protein
MHLKTAGARITDLRPHRVLTDPAKGEDGRRRTARLSLPEKAETQLHG